MSLDTLLEAARYIELQERRLLTEEEPQSPPVSVSVVAVPPRSNGVVARASTPVAVPTAHALTDFTLEHSRPRSNSHGPSVPSPSSSSSASLALCAGAAVPRAGTREVHNKLEKNRRAHLKECFEMLKRQLPATPDDKKTSNLSILGSAIRYIQVLRRKERECEHEMERLAREKIAAQQRLAGLRRDVASRRAQRPRAAETLSDDRNQDRVNGQVLGIPISITSSSPISGSLRLNSSPPRSVNLGTKLRTLPIQITPSSGQVMRAAYGARHNTLTLTALAPVDHPPPHQNGQPGDNGLSPALGTALVHPTHLHLPLSQVVTSGGLVVGPAALQLLSAPAGALRVLQAQPTHLQANESSGSIMMGGLGPLVVSQSGTLLHTHTLTHKMVETQVMKGGVAPLTVSAQYLSAATIVKPLVVVSSAPTPSAPSVTPSTNT